MHRAISDRRGGPLRGAQIDRARGRGHLAWTSIAVLYRTNAQSRAIEDQLVRRRIPYTVVGGPRFYERAEVRDALAYLRVVANPGDVLAFTRAMAAPRRGIGPGCIQKLQAFGAMHGIELGETPAQADMVDGLTATQRRSLATVATLFADLGQAARAGLSFDGLVRIAVDQSGLRGALEAEGTVEAQGRLENLDELISVAAEYQVRPWSRRCRGSSTRSPCNRTPTPWNRTPAASR